MLKSDGGLGTLKPPPLLAYRALLSNLLRFSPFWGLWMILDFVFFRFQLLIEYHEIQIGPWTFLSSDYYYIFINGGGFLEGYQCPPRNFHIYKNWRALLYVLTTIKGNLYTDIVFPYMEISSKTASKWRLPPPPPPPNGSFLRKALCAIIFLIKLSIQNRF